MKISNKNEMEDEFVRIFDAYRGPLKRLCAAYRRSSSEQQDLFQEIAVAIWTALPRYRGGASERTWVYKIAHNVALSFSMRQDSRDRKEQAFEPLEHDRAGTDDSRRAVLLDAIRSLKPPDRHLIILYLEGLTQTEISEITGLSGDNVGVRLSRIRRSLSSNYGAKEPRDE
jgi:RNA polymerase sigma factor (sigma-70 family)